MPGMSYTLEYDPAGIDGDDDLGSPDSDNFGANVIVIGFTRMSLLKAPNAEAWNKQATFAGLNCTTARSHIRFRMLDSGQPFQWVFGPPDNWDDADRAFTTAAQPAVPNTTPISFLGILTHEFGHAMGLGHPKNEYGMMAQGFETWLRGPNHLLRTGLLPDDINGLRALYGNRRDSGHLDLSLSNTWVQTAEDLDATCDPLRESEASARAKLEAAVATNANIEVINQWIARTSEASAERAACEDDLNASQIAQCKVSSRADGWVDVLDADGELCGTRSGSSSAFPVVSGNVCPGAQIQVRFTVNNHSLERDVQANVEMWLSKNQRLNTQRGPDTRLQSIDERTVEIGAGESKVIGQVFRLPTAARAGNSYHVFLRAIPRDPQTGNSLMSQDLHVWNNATRSQGKVTVDPGACPS